VGRLPSLAHRRRLPWFDNGDDPAFGLSFEYPASWVEIPAEQLAPNAVSVQSSYAVWDPTAGMAGATPENCILFIGKRQAGATWTTPVALMEQTLAASQPEGSTPTVVEPTTELTVNGVSGAVTTLSTADATSPSMGRLAIFVSGDRMFMFTFVCLQRDWETCEPIFDSTLNSFRLMVIG
jgi:hypothetical protein